MNKRFDFRMVTCRAYLQKVSDGAFIEHVSVGESLDCKEHFYLHRGLDDDSGSLYVPGVVGEKEESPCEGANDLEKRYFRRKETSFTGVLVGERDVVVTGYLGVDANYDPYSGYGVETRFIFKKPNEAVRCGVVYFANNRKRYVPLEDIDSTEEVNDNG